MKKCIKTITIVTLFMMLGITSLAGGWDVSTADTWAQSEIEDAYMYDLMPYKLVMSNLKDKITRAEFAALVVKMYESMTGEYVEQAPFDTFEDSEDEDVLKANTLGIMKGSNGKANPNNLVTRQEMATMYYRTLDKVYNYFGEEIEATDGILTAKDKDLVASWCTKEVDYINENNIMKGSNGNFNPLDNAPIEQAIVVVKRVYEDELDLIKGTRFIDLSKGYVYKQEKYGNNFTVTFKANGKSNIVKANEYTSLDVTINDSENTKIYYSETYDDAIDEQGLNTYRYDVATNEITCLDDYFGYKVSNVALVDKGKYKGYLLVYPYEDTVYVYNQELEAICVLEGMVTAENANSLIDSKLNAPNDYKQGYTVNDDGYGNISVTFNNNGNTQEIVTSEEGEYRAPNPISNGFNAKTSKDYSRIFFIARQNLDFIKPNSLCYYDFDQKEYGQIGEMSVDVKDYKIVEYNNEFIVVDTGKKIYDVYNIYGAFETNQIFAFDESVIWDNLDAYFTTGLKMVMDGTIVANADYGLSWTYTKGKEWGYSSSMATAAKDKGGPTMYASVENHELRDYQNDAVYECLMQIMSDEKDNGNSGIIFNVESISPGNDNYRGYYVGIDLYKNKLMIGKSNYKWTNLKEFNIGDDIKRGDYIYLKVIRSNSRITVYVNDEYIGEIYDSSYTNGGGMGFRSWNANCNYYNLYAYPNN
ncbi:S-layer homology domain-containing protein [Vallitalea longa]|uniref:S-layer homology domain-containing protein n=1 Tax=Vallitalea longa TaxID=2936439 RepID=UPI00249356FD|nr:S-layer homology domain-containing protein [Vallitalea longa]